MLSYLNVPLAGLLTEIQDDDLPSRPGKNQRFVAAAQNYFLDAQLRVIAEWIVGPNLQS